MKRIFFCTTCRLSTELEEITFDTFYDVKLEWSTYEIVSCIGRRWIFYSFTCLFLGYTLIRKHRTLDGSGSAKPPSILPKPRPLRLSVLKLCMSPWKTGLDEALLVKSYLWSPAIKMTLEQHSVFLSILVSEFFTTTDLLKLKYKSVLLESMSLEYTVRVLGCRSSLELIC